MTMPNFLVIGAGKSGTTALYYYLKQHPQIYMSPMKEPKFFAYEGQKLDFRGPSGTKVSQTSITDIEAYRALFQAVSNEIAIGEVSPEYLYNPRAPERIRHHIPNAKLIAILRNPVDRAYAGYLMQVREGRESYTDFAQALEAEETRIRDNWTFGHYASGGFYYTQLKRYFDLFNQNQIKVYLNEDLNTNAPGLLKDIFQFLEVDNAFLPDLSVRYNVSGAPKNKLLHALVVGINPIKPALKTLLPKGLETILNERYNNLRARYFQYNLVKPQLSPEVRQQLIQTYREDILKLQDLIERDLSKWLE